MMTKGDGVSSNKYFGVHKILDTEEKGLGTIYWIETPRTNTRTKRSQTWLIDKRSDNIYKYRNWKIINNSKKLTIPFTFPPAL